MFLLSRKICFSLVLAIAIQTITVHAHNETMHYPSDLNAVINFVRTCDKRVLIVCGWLLLLGYLLVKSDKEQKKPESKSKELNPIQRQLELLADPDLGLIDQAKSNVFSTPMLFCGLNNILTSIKIILEYAKTVDDFTKLSTLEQQQIRDLIKEKEDAIEAQYKARGLSVLSSFPVGLAVPRIKTLLKDGLPLNSINQTNDFYACTHIQDVVARHGQPGDTQIDHWLEKIPRDRLFVEIQDSQHVIYLEHAKLYAHLTHYYTDAIGAIVTMLENTKTDGLSIG